MSGVTSLSDLLRWPPCPLVTFMTSRSRSPRPFPWQHVTVLVLVAMTTCLAGVHSGELCPSPAPDVLTEAVYKHATPRGRLAAGKYSKVGDASDLTLCVETCCQTPACQVVFFHKDTCYQISCNVTQPKNCDPMDMSGNSKYEDTNMVIVRDYYPKDDTGLSHIVNHRLTSNIRGGNQTTGAQGAANSTQGAQNAPSSGGASNVTTASAENKTTGIAGEAKPESSNISPAPGELHNNNITSSAVNVTSSVADVTSSGDGKAVTSSPDVLTTTTSKPGTNKTSDVISETIEAEAPRPAVNKTSSAITSDQMNIMKASSTTAAINETSQPISAPVTAAPNVSSNAIGQTTLNSSSDGPDLSAMLDGLGPSLSSLGDEDTAPLTGDGDAYGGDGDFSYDLADSMPGDGGGGLFGHEQSRTRRRDMSCTYGLGECVIHEECVLRNSRSKVGLCHCIDGYGRDELTKFCTVRVKAETTVSPKEAESSPDAATTQTPPVKTNTVPLPRKKSNETSDILPPSSSKSPPITKLTVSAGENRTVILPDNSVTLSAFVIPKPEKGEEYNYEWSTVSHPVGAEGAVMADKNTANLKLSKLDVAGLYLFKVVVTSAGKYGSATVNVTVKKAPRINVPPVAMIKPPVQQVQLPNSVVLDGSVSTDDDKIVKYQWEEVTGPLQNIENSNNDVLILKGLVAGEYRFKLTVTDSDGASNHTFANVTVLKETDYAPRANAGSDVVISLPQNAVTLYGNLSTDDHGIVSYEWTKKSEDTLTADMKGVRSPVLQLNKLEQGDYVFTLKVTDTSGQTSTADVHVYVKPENNQPPVARTGTNQVVTLPVSSCSLDGTKSTDDQKISKYKWEQISGPDSAVLQEADKALAKVSNLKLGEYQFKLTVYDEKGLQSEDTMTVTVTENKNFPPKAHAGGDQVVYQPAWLVTLNGSTSVDDKGIVQYQWSRDEQSLAAGEIVNQTDRSPLLRLVNLVPGRYVFTLTVQDADGETDKDTASVVVKKDPTLNDLVELKIGASVYSFSESDKVNWKNQLSLLLRRQSQHGETSIDIVQIQPLDAEKQILIKFYVYTVTKTSRRRWTGLEVKDTLKRKMRTEAAILDFPLLYVDTVVCQNNCSGHGRCDEYSKQCTCDPYWMENFFKANLGDKEKNCDWSILYVVIVVFLLALLLSAALWILVYCRKRCRRRQTTTKRHRYQLLDDFDDANDKKIDMEMSGRGKSSRNHQVIISDSDGSSDEETLFINQKSSNGHLRKTANGHLKQKNKLKT